MSSLTLLARCLCAGALATVAICTAPTASAGIHVLRFSAGDTNAPITNHYITLDSPILNGKPALKPIITLFAAGMVGANKHPVGVAYLAKVPASAGRWAIYNEDLAAMPQGTEFNVLVAGAAKVDATPLNSGNDFTAISKAKGKPAAILLFTHMNNPYTLGSGVGILTLHQGLRYPATAAAGSPLINKWAIFNQDPALPPSATSYFLLDTSTIPAASRTVKLRHTSSAANNNSLYTRIDTGAAFVTDRDMLFISPVGSDGNKAVGVAYPGGWVIFHQDGSAFLPDQQFNVLIVPN